MNPLRRLISEPAALPDSLRTRSIPIEQVGRVFHNLLSNLIRRVTQGLISFESTYDKTRGHHVRVPADGRTLTP